MTVKQVRTLKSSKQIETMLAGMQKTQVSTQKNLEEIYALAADFIAIYLSDKSNNKVNQINGDLQEIEDALGKNGWVYVIFERVLHSTLQEHYKHIYGLIEQIPQNNQEDKNLEYTLSKSEDEKNNTTKNLLHIKDQNGQKPSSVTVTREQADAIRNRSEYNSNDTRSISATKLAEITGYVHENSSTVAKKAALNTLTAGANIDLERTPFPLRQATEKLSISQYAKNIINTKKLVGLYTKNIELTRETTAWEKIRKFFSILFSSEKLSLSALNKVNIFKSTQKKVDAEIAECTQPQALVLK